MQAIRKGRRRGSRERDMTGITTQSEKERRRRKRICKWTGISLASRWSGRSVGDKCARARKMLIIKFKIIPKLHIRQLNRLVVSDVYID